MNKYETIRYIRRLKKDFKKGRHDNPSCYVNRDIRDILDMKSYSSLEIAARFLRIKGYPIEIRIYNIPLSPLCFGRPLSVFRYVSIVY